MFDVNLRPVYEAARSLTQAIANAILPESFCPKRELDGSIYHECECGRCEITSPQKEERDAS